MENEDFIGQLSQNTKLSVEEAEVVNNVLEDNLMIGKKRVSDKIFISVKNSIINIKFLFLLI